MTLSSSSSSSSSSPSVDGRRDPHRSFAELGRFLLDEQPLDAVLERVAELAVDTIPGATEVSLTMLDDDEPRTAAFTGERARRLDERQYDRGFGPCMDAAASGETILVEDTATTTQYPHFGSEAARIGVTQTLSVGLPLPHRTVGALNVYGSAEQSFDRDSVAIAQTFASYAAVAIANAALYHQSVEMARNLQTAMQSRAVIEQAKGILMAQHHCSPDEAFVMLRSASQRSNRKLRDLAQAIVDGTAIPGQR
jgi:GAF domain-containing protein